MLSLTLFLFGGIVAGDSDLFVPVSRESGRALQTAWHSEVIDAGRSDPRHPAIAASVPSSVGARPVPSSDPSGDRLKSGAAFVSASEPPRLRTQSTAFTGNPIVGPTGGVPGDIILLDASQAKAKSYAWEVIPPALDAQGKPLVSIVPMGERAIVSSRPGTRTVILATVDDAGAVHLFQWTVTIGGTPTPVPPIPPDPQPPKPPEPPKPPPVVLAGIAKIAFDEATKVNRPAECKKLAAAQGAIASAIRAGGLKDGAEILDAWRQANRAAVEASAWQAWGLAMKREWEALQAAGKLNESEDFARVLDEVKRGLEAAGG